MTGIIALSFLLYQLNRRYRQLSDNIIGTVFDPYRDVVLITGGCSGLGKELVSVFRKKGAKVVVFDIDISNSSNKFEGVHYYKCDVSDRKQVLKNADLVKKDIGIITILINNAGITTGKSIVDLSYQEIEKTIQINLLSNFYTIKAFLPDMLKIRRGYIVTIASVLGYMSPARLSAYGASKSGLIALHESLTYELGPPSLTPTGVKTLLVCPGQLRTNMFNGVTTPNPILAPELDPHYLAKFVLSSVQLGRRGEVKLPFYGNFLPIFRALPWQITERVRNYSGVDRGMNSYKRLIPKTENTSLVATPESGLDLKTN
ncbi:SDR family oxidoreductase [Ascoidea rubescens DSM 1968]|uniref:Short-chain dehydrogenase/reductase 3 n=1 Tax=Ascoidea rubescens DSM 1968 TaxID=1344418 RepID=A0A1D2VCL3_9ASCO|nr:NAD(P)-binding protein [Ascoidea rubescens DSM 1968]ODV59375.1 NAD(P)-binding protein [Ascoidea rubescens DSM 1968]